MPAPGPMATSSNETWAPDSTSTPASWNPRILPPSIRADPDLTFRTASCAGPWSVSPRRVTACAWTRTAGPELAWMITSPGSPRARMATSLSTTRDSRYKPGSTRISLPALACRRATFRLRHWPSPPLPTRMRCPDPSGSGRTGAGSGSTATAGAPTGPRNASRMAMPRLSASGYRSSGRLARARSTTATRLPGTSLRSTGRIGSGAWRRMQLSTEVVLSPWNGLRPPERIS